MNKECILKYLDEKNEELNGSVAINMNVKKLTFFSQNKCYHSQ